jgi:signal transduction histidine kinase
MILANKFLQVTRHPVIITVMVAIVSLCLWQALRAEQRSQVTRMISREAVNVESEIIARMQARLLALTQIAKRWEEEGRPLQQEWKTVAELNLGHFPGYYALAWVDPWLMTRWVAPSVGNDAVQEVDLIFREHWRGIIEAIRNRREIIVTSVVSLPEGKKGFLAGVPIDRDEDFDGVIVGIFNLQELLNAILHENLAPEYAVAVFENEREIYSHTDANRKHEAQWGQDVTLALYDISWRMRIWPRRQPFTGARSLLPDIVLGGGLVLALLLGTAVHLANTAEKRAREAEAANRVKSDLLATVSHELRTPVNLIMGYTELLLNENFGRLVPQQTEPLQRVEKSARELRDLISAVFDVCRLEAAHEVLATTPVRIAEVLDELEAEAQELRENPEVRYQRRTPSELAPVYTDRTKLKIVLKNLLQNAAKFTDKGRITVDAYQRNSGVIISIADTGIGIEPEMLPQIFEMFQQGDNSLTRRYGGLGLGLYVVRKLLELIHGKIEVESTVGQGSTFRVWIPLHWSGHEPRDDTDHKPTLEPGLLVRSSEYA